MFAIDKRLPTRALPCLEACLARWRLCRCALVPGLKSGALVDSAPLDSWSVAYSTAATRSPNNTWVVVVSTPSGLRCVYSNVAGKSVSLRGSMNLYCVLAQIFGNLPRPQVLFDQGGRQAKASP